MCKFYIITNMISLSFGHLFDSVLMDDHDHESDHDHDPVASCRVFLYSYI